VALIGACALAAQTSAMLGTDVAGTSRHGHDPPGRLGARGGLGEARREAQTGGTVRTARTAWRGRARRSGRRDAAFRHKFIQTTTV
jgi:hypothetical protein